MYKDLINKGELILVNDILLTKDQHAAYQNAKTQATYFDMLQGVRKVLLNSTYGALLNEYSRFGDGRLGASVTYTGRQITSHMINTVSKGLAPEGQAALIVKTFSPETKKDAKTGTDGLKDLHWGQNFYSVDIEKGSGPIYGDTDSVAEDTIVVINGVIDTIKNHFEQGAEGIYHNLRDKEFKSLSNAVSVTGERIEALYRHKTNKRKFKITLINGKSVIVTEDHSVMIKRNGELVEAEPVQINKGDICICIKHDSNLVKTQEVAVDSVEELSPFDNEYVYDVIMADKTDHTFFANDILVHNSVYFTYENIVKGIDDIDVLVEAANAIANDVNDSFPGFMREAFNCQAGFDGLIKANRELVCQTGVIQAKKKYMMLVVDKEGKRIKPGDDDELKTMGSDIKLSSTPEMIRTMLSEVVMNILNEQPKKLIDDIIISFRREMGKNALVKLNPLDLASVSSVNNLEVAWTLWNMKERNGMGKANIPHNARPAIHHNYMLEHFKVQDAEPIKSGKVKIVWLLENEFKFKNIAFPSEVEVLPEWFTKHFEVDMALMEQKLVDQKLKLIFQALDWEVPTFQTQLVNTLLEF
jgi:hypothetical protein